MAKFEKEKQFVVLTPNYVNTKNLSRDYRLTDRYPRKQLLPIFIFSWLLAIVSILFSIGTKNLSQDYRLTDRYPYESNNSFCALCHSNSWGSILSGVLSLERSRFGQLCAISFFRRVRNRSHGQSTTTRPSRLPLCFGASPFRANPMLLAVSCLGVKPLSLAFPLESVAALVAYFIRFKQKIQVQAQPC